MESGIHVRIDNRLLHGQVVQFWIPYLEIDHLVIADDVAAANQTMISVYRMAVPSRVTLSVVCVDQLDAEIKKNSSSSLLVILSDIQEAVNAKKHGFVFDKLTIGNVHAQDDRVRITDSVYLADSEITMLKQLCNQNIAVEIQTFPGESLGMNIDESGGVRWQKR